MISEIYILFFKASLTIRHTATVSQKKSGTSKKIQWDFQISRVGSLDFLDLKVNGSPVPSSFLAHLSRRLMGEQIVYQSLRRPSFVRPSTISNISETTGPIKFKFHMETPWDAGTKVCSNGPGHMTKMAARRIYGKTL